MILIDRCKFFGVRKLVLDSADLNKFKIEFSSDSEKKYALVGD